MCIICIDIEKERLTPLEALRNYVEMEPHMEENHAAKVAMIIEEYLLASNSCVWCECTPCDCDYGYED